MVNNEKRNLLKKSLLGLAGAAIGIQSARAVITNIGTDRVTSNNATLNGTDVVPRLDASTAHISATAPHTGHATVSGDITITQTVGQTYAEVVASLKNLTTGNITINLLAGTFIETLVIGGIKMASGKTLTINGATPTVIISTTCTGGGLGSNTVQPTVNKAGLTANAYNNKLIKFTSGTNNGQWRIVDYNSTTIIYLCGARLPASPANGDSYTIYDWSTRIEPTAAMALQCSNQNSIIFNDILFKNTHALTTNEPHVINISATFNRCALHAHGTKWCVIEYNNSLIYGDGAARAFDFFGINNITMNGGKMTSSASIVGLMRIGYMLIRYGAVIDGNSAAAYGLYNTVGGITQNDLGSVVADRMYCFVKNCVTYGIYVYDGGIYAGTLANYSNNGTNYALNASTDAWIT